MERYGVWANNHVAQMKPEVKGDWVRYADAQATVEALKKERDEARHTADVYQKLYGTVVMDRATVFNDLSELQELVRALPVVETELSDKHRAIHISASISINSEVHGLVDPLKALLDYRRTLDATTPAPIDAAETHDRMFNHMDRHPEAL